MKAVCLHGYGDIDKLQVEDVVLPKPGPGELLIRLETSAVNHFDLILRQGFMADYLPLAFPTILGGEGAGVIASIGPGVIGFVVGDRVVAHFDAHRLSAHAAYAVVGVAGIAHLPQCLSFEQGATLAYAGLTARQLVDTLGVRASDRVLVSGALGGVGRAAVQYLKAIGAHPVAGVLPSQMQRARQLAGEALDLTVAPASPSFDLAIGAAQPAAAQLIAHVREGGCIASAVVTPESANSKRVSIQMIAHHDDPVMLQAIVDAAAAGDLDIPIAKTFALEQLGEAHRALAAGVEGKIVLQH